MKKETEEKYEQAVTDFLSENSKSIRKAANKFGVAKSALYRYIVTADSYKGQGRKNVVLTEEEERKIVDYILFRKTIGCGMSLYQVQLLIQEVLIAVCSANPDRTSPYADSNHMPNKMFVSRFVSKHGLTLRAALEISKGRQILTKFDLEKWQQETQEGLVNHPKFQDCFLDSSRIFNQDETSLQIGVDKQKIVAKVGTTEMLYNKSGSTRDHVTVSFTVQANGGVVAVRVVNRGKRNVALNHLKDLETTGKSGAWKFGVTDNGYVTRIEFLNILQDLDEYLTKHDIVRPVVLFLDGYKGHYGLDVIEFCELKQIQLWLLRANMTHLLQPLDLTLFK